MNLDHLAYKQYKVTKLLKKLDELKKEIRGQLFQEADERYKTEHWHLPMTTWEIPLEFFEKTGMTREEFVKSRFPSWSVVSSKEDGEGIVYVLKKRPQFMPWSHQSDEFEITRSISEITPEVDWDAMRLVEPELFDKFAKPVISYELNADAFNEYQKEHPQFGGQGFLVRYTKHKPPTLRVLSKVVKENE